MLAPAIMSSIEINDRATALALFAHLQQRAAERGITLREPPPEPTGCCGRGCTGCVWEGFYAAAGWWYEDALLLIGD